MAIINVDDAYILNETGAQVDKTTGIPFENESLTEAEAAQARANIRAGGTNPNLLDNPFFTINQRGFTGGSTVGYTVDRWKNDNGSAITFSGGVIGLPANAVFIQPIEPDLYAELVGKTVTLSVLYSDGTIASGTITVPSSGSTYATGTPRLAMNGTSKRFFCSPPTNISVRAFKLELGTVSTLANDLPPDYATELAKCQRYFLKLADVAYACMCGANSAVVGVPVPTPVTMRDTVQIQAASVGWIRGGGNTYSSSASANNMTPRPKPNTVAIDVTHGVSGLSTMTLYWINFSQLVFSADL